MTPVTVAALKSNQKPFNPQLQQIWQRGYQPRRAEVKPHSRPLNPKRLKVQF